MAEACSVLQELFDKCKGDNGEPNFVRPSGLHLHVVSIQEIALKGIPDKMSYRLKLSDGIVYVDSLVCIPFAYTLKGKIEKNNVLDVTKLSFNKIGDTMYDEFDTRQLCSVFFDVLIYRHLLIADCIVTKETKKFKNETKPLALH